MESVELRTSLKMADMELDMTLEKDECWLSITDTASNDQVTLPCTPEQVAAIWFLAISGTTTSELMDYLYKLAGPVCDNLPSNLRPIP